VTYRAQNQLNVEYKKRRKSRGTNRIPSNCGIESVSAATRVRAKCDVVEARAAYVVQPEVEKAERGLAV